MNKKNQDKFKVVSLNFAKERHKGLLEWLYKESEDREMALSSFCISILKLYKADMENDNEWQTNEHNNA